MEKEISLFPLNLVAFPGEQLNLHIFEPRYKDLVNDCLNTKTTFGIPSYVLNKIEFGTEVKIDEVTKVYDDGRMDIKTMGLRVFRVVEYHNPWENKEYAGGVVELIDFNDGYDSSLHIAIVDLMSELFDWLKIDNELDVSYSQPMYKFIHKIGLKLDEEYAMLSMKNEKMRQKYVLEASSEARANARARRARTR